jgi:hypothetical protein
VNVRNVLALVGMTLLATVVSLKLHGWLYALTGQMLWLLCNLGVYSGATLLLLRSLAGLRQLKCVIAFGVLGATVRLGLSVWLLLNSEVLRLLRAEPDGGGDAASALLLLMLPGIAFEVLAPIGGALLGWLMWRRSSRMASAATS